jgi:hypothetical protein
LTDFPTAAKIKRKRRRMGRENVALRNSPRFIGKGDANEPSTFSRWPSQPP